MSGSPSRLSSPDTFTFADENSFLWKKFVKYVVVMFFLILLMIERKFEFLKVYAFVPGPHYEMEMRGLVDVIKAYFGVAGDVSPIVWKSLKKKLCMPNTL
jgi:hypothetical protein